MDLYIRRYRSMTKDDLPSPTLRPTSLSGTFLQARKDVVNQCLEFGLARLTNVYIYTHNFFIIFLVNFFFF